MRSGASALVAALYAAQSHAEDPAPAPGNDVARYEGGKIDGGVSEKANDRVKLVLDSLTSILTSVQEAERKDAGNYKCFMEWCEKELTSTKTSSADTQNELEQGQVEAKESDALVASLNHELKGNKEEREEVNDVLAQATSVRDKDRDDYEDEATTNAQSLKQIDHAIKIVGEVHRQGGFLQHGQLERSKLNEPGESNYVLGIMQGLKTKLEKTKAKIDKAEVEKEGQYDRLTRTKKEHLASLVDDYQEKQVNLNREKATLATSNNDIEDASSDVKDLKKYLVEVEARCQEKSKEWKVTSKDRQAEKAALREAMSFIKQAMSEDAEPAAAILEVDVHAAQRSADGSNEALLQLFRLHRKSHGGASHALRLHRSSRRAATPIASDPGHLASSLAEAADAQFAALLATSTAENRKEGFDGAVKVVQQLAETLQEQQKEEDEKRKYCESELEVKDEQQQEIGEKLDRLEADIERQQSTVELCVQELAALERLQEQAKANDDEARELRRQEFNALQSATKDRELAVKVLHQAKAVLQKFYDSKQQGGERHSVQSASAMIMLDKVAEDIEVEQRDAAKEDKDASFEFHRYMEQSKEAFDERQERITMHATRKARGLVKLNDAKEERATVASDKEIIEAEIASLHEECDQLLRNHEAREKARFFEISQLRDVVDILSGSSIAARTGSAALTQARAGPGLAKDGHLDDDDLAALQAIASSVNGLEAKALALSKL